MAVYRFQGIVPVIEPGSYVHPTATLIGDVLVGSGCFIAPGASLRGDFGRVVVEGDSSIQDGCCLHTSSTSDCIVGRGATIGHGAVLHGCRIGEHTLVGINTVILDDAEIGPECLVAAMTLVRSQMHVPARSLVAGNPARVIRNFDAEQITWRNVGDGEYQRLTREALADLVECEPLLAAEPDRPRVRSNAIAVRVGGTTAQERELRAASSNQQDVGRR
jgi:phenylacetic acid degradation protein